MATSIQMVHPQTGVIKKGVYGFSWTTLFFSGIPAICRGDLMTGVLVLIASMLTSGLAGVVWAFVYNKRYTLGLLEKGYRFYDEPEKVKKACYSLGVLEY